MKDLFWTALAVTVVGSICFLSILYQWVERAF